MSTSLTRGGTASVPRRPDARLETGLIVGGWTLVGLVFGSATYIRSRMFGDPMAFPQVALSTAVDVYSWAVIMLVVFRATRRYPLMRSRTARNFLVLAALGLLLVTVRSVGLYYFFVSTGSYDRTLAQSLISAIPIYFVSYWMLVGVAHAVELAKRLKERDLRSAQLETQLARAQLQMLKMQLHPHFLFNTLHAISTLVHRDAEAAERMIASLSELLRATLAHQQSQEVTVREEMDLLEPYLDIEKTRLGDRLAIHIAVDPEARDARVPHLILQPLVENAIRHGIAPRRQGGTVEISVQREDGQLLLEVRDDGQGFARGAVSARRGGVGLNNTRARLEQLYPEAHRLSVSSTPGSGTCVEIAIPYRVARTAPELTAAW